MFSELRHHSRYQTVLSQTDPVPQFIQRSWTDRAAVDRSGSMQYGAQEKILKIIKEIVAFYFL
jgi:hypothetical protein